MHHIGQIDRNLSAVGRSGNIIAVDCRYLIDGQICYNPLMHLVLDLPQQDNAGTGINNAHHVGQVSTVAVRSSVVPLQKVRVWGRSVNIFITCLPAYPRVESVVVCKKALGIRSFDIEGTEPPTVAPDNDAADCR